MRTLILLLCSLGLIASEVVIPPGIDHGPWDALLQRHVDERGLVDYPGWRDHIDDRAALDAYLAQYARSPEQAATGAERHAALLNAYNAFTVRRVLIRELDAGDSFWSGSPFKQRIHPVGGQEVSLDDIEHRAVRPEVGYRGHAALVCAALSCPPLWRHAYTAENLEQALDQRMAAWLAYEDLNQFDHEAGTVRISKIFDWFGEDFAAAGGLPTVLGRHGPEALRPWLSAGDYRIGFMPYDKDLNAQGGE